MTTIVVGLPLACHNNNNNIVILLISGIIFYRYIIINNYLDLSFTVPAVSESTMNTNKIGVTLLLLVGNALATISMATAQSCNACNCQFNNVQALSQLMKKEVKHALANEPRKSNYIII